MKGKIRGKRKMRLHIWKKRGIQKTCAHMAHREGMRVAHVCAWKTSALAYDGSGKVERDPDNHSLCTFRNGKRYNCDLSASLTVQEKWRGIPTTTAFVRSETERDITATFQRPII